MINAPGRSGTISPLSFESNDSSLVSRYQNLNGADSPYATAFPPNHPLNHARIHPPTSPPASQHTSSPTENGLPSLSSRLSDGRTTSAQSRSSPPNSIARSSGGNGTFPSVASESGRSLKPGHEEALQEHYKALKTYLSAYLRDEKGNARPNKARDKLLRLSVTQFQELSTDVYDELLRREDERNARGNNIPRFLLPRQNFHPKRNQARQKLSTLPIERFRQLATDVFYELERRVPRFAEADIERIASPAASVSSNQRAPSRNGIGSPGGMRAPPPRQRPLMSDDTTPPTSYRSYRGSSPNSNANTGPARPPTSGSTMSNDFGRPLPKTFQSSTIVPNKSTMVEDDDSDSESAFDLGKVVSGLSKHPNDHDVPLLSPIKSNARHESGARSRETHVVELQEKIDSLESRLFSRDEAHEKLKDEHESLRIVSKEREDSFGSERTDWLNFRDELEHRTEEAQRLNDVLRREIEQLRQSNAHVEKDLRSQLAGAHAENEGLRNREIVQPAVQTKDDNEWRSRCESLEQELANQQKITDSVRRDGMQFLQEMRILSQRNDSALESEEKLLTQVSEMRREVEHWKSRYARSRAQVRNLRASAIGLPPQGFNAGSLAEREGLVTEDGLVQDVHVTKFQLSIDQLLQTARQADTNAFLESVKAVASCARAITSDAVASTSTSAAASPSPSPASPRSAQHDPARPPSAAELKRRAEAAANALITASRIHAGSHGLAPVSLVDASASHLTHAIVRLVETLGIRRTERRAQDDDDDDDDDLHTVPEHGKETDTTPEPGIARTFTAIVNGAGAPPPPPSKSQTGGWFSRFTSGLEDASEDDEGGDVEDEDGARVKAEVEEEEVEEEYDPYAVGKTQEVRGLRVRS
ncbi:component of the polarisome [Elasticomyces elasticus]|nr:component of the polarisome [Elasticomyces elasticus]